MDLLFPVLFSLLLRRLHPLKLTLPHNLVTSLGTDDLSSFSLTKPHVWSWDPICTHMQLWPSWGLSPGLYVLGRRLHTTYLQRIVFLKGQRRDEYSFRKLNMTKFIFAIR